MGKRIWINKQYILKNAANYTKNIYSVLILVRENVILSDYRRIPVLRKDTIYLSGCGR